MTEGYNDRGFTAPVPMNFYSRDPLHEMMAMFFVNVWYQYREWPTEEVEHQLRESPLCELDDDNTFVLSEYGKRVFDIALSAQDDRVAKAVTAIQQRTSRA